MAIRVGQVPVDDLPDDVAANVGKAVPIDDLPDDLKTQSTAQGPGGFSGVYQGVGKALLPLVRPGLEGLGMAAGATIGAPTALISGPAGPILGAGLGFAGGKAVADLLDKYLGQKPPETVPQMAAGLPTDVATGAAYEMGGQVIGNLAGKAWNLLKSGIPKKAGEELIQATSKGPQYAKNAAEAAKIEEETGAQFTRGQRSNDPIAIMQERSLARQGAAASAIAEQRAAVNEKLRQYYGREFSQGEVDDVINFLQGEQQRLQSGVSTAQQASEAAAQGIKGQTPQESGQAIVKALKGGRAAAKAKAEELYNRVGEDVPVDVSKLHEDVFRIAEKKSSFEDEANIPAILGKIKEYFRKSAMTQKLGERAELLDSIKSLGGIAPKTEAGRVGSGIYDGFDESFGEGPKYLIRRSGLAPDDLKESLNNIGYDFGSVSEMYQAVRNAHRVGQDIKAGLYDLGGDVGTMSFSDLRGLRTTVLNEIRNEAGATAPNAPKLQRLRDLKQSIEETIDQLGKEPGEAGEAYRTASKFYREEYAQKFKQGPVAEALRPGFRGEETRVPMSDIAGKFFRAGKVDAADQFISAVGGNAEAKQAIKDYAANDLLQSATDPRTGQISFSKLANWNFKNRSVLQRFGLDKAFENVTSAQKAIESASGALSEFQKSAAAKMLGADSEQAIAAAFSGSGKNTESVAMDLMNAVRGNKAAESGLKKGFADFLLRKMETTGTDIAGSPILSVAASKKLMAQYAPAMRVIYSSEPQKIKALVTMQRALEIAGRSSRSPLAGGSDTAENIMNAVGEVVRGKVTESIVPGWLRAISKVFSSYKDEQVKKLLTRATIDPEYAQSLIDLVKGFKPAEARVRSLLGSIVGPSTFGDEPLRMEAAH